MEQWKFIKKIVCRYLDEQSVLHGDTKTFILSIPSSHIHNTDGFFHFIMIVLLCYLSCYHDCVMIIDSMIVRLVLCTRVWSLWVQSSMLQMTTGQHTWCRMKSLVLPRIVLLITPTPLVPVTTNLGFASLMNSVIAYSGFKSTFSIRISTSIWKIEKIKCLINPLRNNVRNKYDLHLREKKIS